MFVKRALGFTMELGQGSFGISGSTTVEIPGGLWASALISKVGAPSYNEAQIQIAGLDLDLMNEVSRTGLLAAAYRDNSITVKAGTAGEALSTVFVGGVQEAWIDFRGAEAILTISANTGMLAAMKTAKPSSYTGSTDVVTIMQTLADQMGYQLENAGVTGQVSTPYLAGSARDQALQVADAGGFFVYFEDDGGAMVICPKEGSRSTFAPTVSPDTGMEGYPCYVGPGMMRLTTEYNPQLRLLGNVVVENSIVKNANGTFRVFELKHDLSTRPGGPWFSRIVANNIPQQTGGPASA